MWTASIVQLGAARVNSHPTLNPPAVELRAGDITMRKLTREQWLDRMGIAVLIVLVLGLVFLLPGS